MEPTIISVREHKDYAREAIRFFQTHWASDESRMVYEDCIMSSLDTVAPLPQWYLLLGQHRIIGGAGLITNDFISRMDLWPWLCALYVERDCRGHSYGALLIERIKNDARRMGFSKLYLCSDHVGYYERYGFEKIATGYHPWGESSPIFRAEL